MMYGGKLVALDTPAALKHGTIAGDVLEVEGTPQEQTRDLVAGLPGVREVAPYGARLHAIVDDARLREPQISGALQAAGIADVRVEQIEPSLEDVFVALVGEQTASA
jgi:ABC-2 type transport system ATP-binding protein